jgi:GntP family gluconate:H+ symporter
MAVLHLLIVFSFLLLAITRFRVHAFLALTLSSLLLGLLGGISLANVAAEFLRGFGNILEWIGVVLVLGAAIGEVLSETWASLSISSGILRFLGQKRLPFALTASGYVISIPAFVDVAYIMMKPVTEALAVRSRRPVLVAGLCLTAGLTASHALLPPTPGPLAAAGILGADLGKVVLVNLVVAAFVATGGLLWAVYGCSNARLEYDRKLQEDFRQGDPGEKEKNLPGFWRSVTPILLPLILIAAGAFAGKSEEGWVTELFKALGTPLVALLAGFLSAVILLKRRDLGASALEKGIQKSASVLLITGAGGGLGAVIKASGVGEQIAYAFEGANIPGLIFPFLLAMTLTTATGSLTVSMVTTSSVVSPMLKTFDLSPEMAVALVGAGSLCVIHANASFFWLLGKLHEVPPGLLYRTFSVQSLVMSFSGLLAVLLLRLMGIT